MVIFPIDKYLAQDYRATLRTFDAPQDIDTKSPLVPVIDIQKGFTKPNSKQRLASYEIVKDGVSTGTTQIVTNNTTTKYYYVGIHYQAAGTNDLYIEDLNTGSPGLADGGTGMFINISSSTATLYDNMINFPIETNYGIRFYWNAAAGASIRAIVFYIEEKI